jgi:arginase family enzyme
LKKLKNTLNEQFALGRSTSKEANSRHEALPFFPIVIGGPCTIESAIISSITAHVSDKKLGLLWVDNDADLTLATKLVDGVVTGMKKRSGKE